MGSARQQKLVAYACDVCNRSVKLPVDPFSVDSSSACKITRDCKGNLTKILSLAQAAKAPTFPTPVANLQDWFARPVFFNFDQTIESDVWTITHNLGIKPAIHAFVNIVVNGAVTPTETSAYEVLVDNLNTISLKFARPFSGQVHCVASASRNYVNPQAANATTTSAVDVPLSTSDGTVAIATLSNNSIVNLQVTFITGTASKVNVTYVGLPIGGTIQSPWAGSSTVVIAGKRYSVRSFNLATTPLAPSYFQSGAIPEGATFAVTAIDGIPIKSGELVYLLANKPYSVVDRIRDRYVDGYKHITVDSLPFTYANGMGTVPDTKLSSTYPLIISI